MKNNTLVIGTRGSALALYQANEMKRVITETFPTLSIEVKIIHTKGDKILDVSLSKIGDKGLFTKELEVALLDEEIDMAVHSLKDLPTFFPEGLKLGAVLPRAEVRDALVSKNGKKLHELTPNDKIATSSLRRKAQLLAINPDFQIIDIRGNVNTRLKKMDEGHCDAMIMAATGLQRLNLQDRITEIIEPNYILPAVSQGIIGAETRDNDSELDIILNKINDDQSWKIGLAERAFLKAMDGGCQVPVGCYSDTRDGQFCFTGLVASLDGKHVIKKSAKGSLDDATNLALEVSKALIEEGADKILDEIRNSATDQKE